MTVAAYDPEAMAFPGVTGCFPAVGYHGSTPDLDDQIAYGKTGFIGHAHEIAMGPTRAMIIHHVGNFRQQQTFRLEDPLGFFQKRWI
ncbi:MAG: hypothetical protein OXC96_10015 [Cyanobacteria bacterium MAG CAR1_bin_15]|nr:hypothetical protein [Cyanobacteria bacterium MAG CAR1_bin_15]